MRIPDFICIGAPKTATTWLHANLCQHPDLWLAPAKELHYFNVPMHTPPDEALEYQLSLCARALQIQLEQKRYELEPLRWLAQFAFTENKDDDWYLSLFDPAGTKLAGEMTPAYVLLEREQIEHMYKLAPKVKILFIMRNPIDRIWSEIRFFKQRGIFNGSTTDLNAINNHLRIEESLKRTMYMKIIEKWTSVFPEAQFHCLFYDDIIDSPLDFLEKLCGILGVNFNSTWFLKTLALRINSSVQEAITPAVRSLIAKKYLEPTKELEKHLGNHATKWVKQMDSCIVETT